ncbi:hypothetical protein ATB99_14360 [Elizabethkingia meningoseptica]|uniref:FISUMP domain-containing protein n=2 Tax=Elizabethkingia meningoseptica TaxID=238 RepID=UPI000332D296|nr:FISUMP domain-containing protein [Elizabethkingia meningoseptica]AQX06616.1 hypothetical protein BBD33_15755 [Elizabethkingia meningoseptica]AQX48664.1 hypothetical protein B5G46_15750 [Elizabethkingia meningoseptica]EOR28767.1 hypothetical protein L100_14745 [Elizabethkingia meningoseptica ATCC 13253 = NBRC 12535]KUY13718.1 hypothetical protein ATB99_14360 [Elizabethkingia meningoseptica]OPB75613.1 hypothetical protein BAY30_00710 [Elizabethkingia meningoseptica]
MRRKNIFLTTAAVFLVLLACRSNDTDTQLNSSGSRAVVKVNFTGLSFADTHQAQPQASLNRSIMNTNPKQTKTDLVDPGTFITTEVKPAVQNFGVQASLGNTMASVVGAPLGNGIKFRVIFYKAGTYQAYRDYIIVNGQTELADPLQGELWLEDSVAYDVVAYSYNANSLPVISSNEKNNISTAKIYFDNNNPDLLYWKGIKTFAKGTQTLDLTLRHKTAMIQSITVIVTNPPLTLAGSSIANATLLIPNYTNGEIAFSGSGSISGRTNSAPVNKSLSFTTTGSTRTATNLGNLLINADTNGQKLAIYTADITTTDISKSPALTSTTNISASFKITPEYKHDLTLSIKKCGAYTAPGVWKEFACHNLGDNTGNSPVIADASIFGAKYKWGALNTMTTSPIRYLSQTDDQSKGIIGQPGWGLTFTSFSDACSVELGTGWRVPTKAEWDGVIANNSINRIGVPFADGSFTDAVKFGDNLFLPIAGSRTYDNGAVSNRGTVARYWSSTDAQNPSTAAWTNAWHLAITETSAATNSSDQRHGMSIRCIKD